MNGILNKPLTESHTKLQPHSVLWVTIVFILGFSYFYKDKVVDIQLHDTYFVTDTLFLGGLFSIILGAIGCLYFLFRKKKLIRWITYFHVGLTILSMSFVFSYFIGPKNGSVDLEKIIHSVFIIILLCIISQLLFIINLVISRSEK